MIQEVSDSVQFAYKICSILDKYNTALEVHTDINKDPNFNSNVAFKEAMCYILGMGYTFNPHYSQKMGYKAKLPATMEMLEIVCPQNLGCNSIG